MIERSSPALAVAPRDGCNDNEGVENHSGSFMTEEHTMPNRRFLDHCEPGKTDALAIVPVATAARARIRPAVVGSTRSRGSNAAD
jgi:hypothetical protein